MCHPSLPFDSTSIPQHTHIYILYIYIPRTQLTSIFEGQPSKTRPFPIKTRVIWVYIYIYGSVSRVATPPPMVWSPPPPPIPHTFCTRHCSETYISILLHARRCSETHIFILLDEPSRRIRWVDRAKLWRNANFKLQELLRAVHRTLQCSANGINHIHIHIHVHTHS